MLWGYWMSRQTESLPEMRRWRRRRLNYCGTFSSTKHIACAYCSMAEVIEIPIELTRFQLPQAVQAHLQFLLDRQDEGNVLSQAERQEAEGLVKLAEFLSFVRSMDRAGMLDHPRHLDHIARQ
jgi:hypothetical protein